MPLTQVGKFPFKVKNFISILACIRTVSVAQCSSACEDSTSEPPHQTVQKEKHQQIGRKFKDLIKTQRVCHCQSRTETFGCTRS